MRSLLSLLLLTSSFALQPIQSPSRLQSALQVASAVSTDGLTASNANELNPLKAGSTVALVTPLTDHGDIDEASLRKLLQYHVESGTENVCILGTTGEASVMDMAERKKVLDITVSEVKGQLPILVGCSTINPKTVQENMQQALDCGGDTALVVTPYYVKPPQRCLIHFYTDLANAVDIPLCMYNVPGRTAVDMTDVSIGIAAMHENIIGVKDATGDVSRVASLQEQLQMNDVSDFLILSGDDGSSKDFCLQGGDGCISVTANVAAPQIRRIMDAARNMNAHSANVGNASLELLHQDLFLESNPIPVKWALKRLGLIDTDYCRPPLDRLESKHEGQLETALRQAGLV